MSKIIRSKKVCELTGLSKSTIYSMIAEGTFPKQVKLGVRSVGWKLEEVQGWISSRSEVVADLSNNNLPKGV